MPCTATAMGKAMLMHLSEEEVTKHLGNDKPLRGVTDRSLRTRNQLESELAEFRTCGWTPSQQEAHAGLTSVGAAILDDNGHPIAAISVSFF